MRKGDSLTSFQLKLIAICAMTIDHIANIIGQWALFPNMPSSQSYTIIKIMNAVGRIAFPLFAFLISEGANKTRSMPKYIGRLATFAMISEPFFYFSHWRNGPTISGFFRNFLSHNLGNVFFTLALGAIAIYICQLLERRQMKYVRLLSIAIVLGVSLIGGYIGCDYGIAGIVLIGFLFLAQTKLQKCIVTLIWCVCLYGFGQAYNPIGSILRDCMFASLSSVLIWFYNGKHGRPLKWSFYIYYPAHLFALTVIHAIIR